MTINRDELQDSARRAFGEAGLVPDAEASWQTLAEMGALKANCTTAYAHIAEEAMLIFTKKMRDGH